MRRRSDIRSGSEVGLDSRTSESSGSSLSFRTFVYFNKFSLFVVCYHEVSDAGAIFDSESMGGKVNQTRSEWAAMFGIVCSWGVGHSESFFKCQSSCVAHLSV